MESLAYILISTGVIFFLWTTICPLHFPDFYSRMHSACKGDTLSTVLILLGCICLVATQGGMNWLLGLKILLIINFIFIGSPTATHAMMDAGNKAGAEPWKKDSE